MFKHLSNALAGAGIVTAAALAASCQPMDTGNLRGAVDIDGSSTVFPITEAVAEEFAEIAPSVDVQIGISGTGGGFKRFAVGETDISNASRPIKAKEYEAANSNGVEFIELPVAYDGLTIVVNRANYWVDALTVDELKMIFLADKAAKTWKEINPEWPEIKISIYSPGTDSGTFDYFKEVVAGKAGSIRSDMSVSEDDNVLVRGVSGQEGAIGFFGCAYFFENKKKLKAVPIVNPDTGKAVTPTAKTIEEGDYAPFSRPLFIYVNAESAKRPEVRDFVLFYLNEGPELAEDVGYVQLPQAVRKQAETNFTNGRTGTHFLDANGEQLHGPVTELYK